MSLDSVTLVQPKLDQNSLYCTLAKRTLDILVASFLFVCCLPIMSLAALLIMLDGQGSPLFRQTRVGRNGSLFVLYKLRTMCSGSEHLGFCTTDQDPRVTRVGALLRDTKTDELPQLWNVIKGDMSLIGPRPLSLDETNYLLETEQFSHASPGFIPSVLPGMTGWEQCTRSSLLPYNHRFQLNNYYEHNMSLWLDLWVIKRTVFACPLVCTLAFVSVLIALASFCGLILY